MPDQPAPAQMPGERPQVMPVAHARPPGHAHHAPRVDHHLTDSTAERTFESHSVPADDAGSSLATFWLAFTPSCCLVRFYHLHFCLQVYKCEYGWRIE